MGNMNKSISTNSDATIYTAFYYRLQISILKQSRILMIIHFWLFNSWRASREEWTAYYVILDNYRNNILHFENHWTYWYWKERP